MKKYLLNIVCLLYFCSIMGQNTVDLPLVKVVSKDFKSILDTFIQKEKTCEYYSSKTIFVFWYAYYDDILYFELTSGENRYSIIEQERFCFEYGGHLVLIWGYDDLPRKVFKTTRKKQKIFLSDKKPFEENDGYSRWQYSYRNNSFTLLEIMSFCY